MIWRCSFSSLYPKKEDISTAGGRRKPKACNSVFFSHMFKANCKHPPTSTHSARFAEFALSLTQQYLLKFRRKMKNPSAHTYPIFFLMQRRISAFAINPPQKSNAFLPPCGRNTIPIVLSVFFFEKLLPATADRTPSAVVLRQVCWALLFCTIFGRGNLHENYES